MNRAVIFVPNPLLLNAIELDSEGRIVRGWVVNGGWELRAYHQSVHGVEFEARDHNGVLQYRWETGLEFPIIPVCRHMQGGYNSIIKWAHTQLVK